MDRLESPDDGGAIDAKVFANSIRRCTLAEHLPRLFDGELGLWGAATVITAATCGMRDVAASDEPATHCIDMAADRRRNDRHRRTGQMQFFNPGSSLA
jgi:hypothetical protein